MTSAREEITEMDRFVSITIDAHGLQILPDEDGIQLLAADIINNIRAMPPPVGFIYRVPSRFRADDVKKYEPLVVSIGPFHRGKGTLSITDDHKKWYLCNLINRSSVHDIVKTDWQDIVKTVWQIEEKARRCYAEKIDLNREDFITMMILDGCFIIELFYRYTEYQGKTEKEQKSMQLEDFIFCDSWMVHALQRDLVLLENQIPFIVLEHLFNLTKDPNFDWTLKEIAFNFLDLELLGSRKITDCRLEINKIPGHHLLDWIRNCLLGGIEIEPEKSSKYGLWTFTNYASELKDFGVQFKRKEKYSSLLDITFKESGVLEIPPFPYGYGVTILLPNLIALEQHHRRYKDHIASYVMFMDSLINSNDDVKLLREVIGASEDEIFASEINSLCNRLEIDTFYYEVLSVKVRDYCHSHRWRASFTLNRFSIVWKILSIATASVVTVITIAQFVISFFGK